MAALNQAHANNIVDASLGTATFIATVAPLRVRLMTANGSATANGTEVTTAGGYTAGAGLTVTYAAASASSAASNVVVTWTNMPAVTVVGVEEWDSAGTPVRKWFGPLSATKTTNAGDTFTFASGALVNGIG